MGLKLSTVGISLILGCTHLLGASSSSSSNAVAQGHLEGRVRVTGSEGSETTSLQDKDAKSNDLCMSPLAKKIGHLSGMKTHVLGTMRASKPECFEAQSFTVIDTGSGRAALVGILSKQGMNFLVTREDGTKQELEKVPKGLQELIGKKVIIDVKPMDGMKDSGSKSMRVVSYSEFP